MGLRRRNASQYLHPRWTTSSSCFDSGCWHRYRSINNTSRKCINEFSAKFSVYKMQKMRKKERSKMLIVYLFCNLNGSINHCLTGFQGAPRAWQRFEYVGIAIVVVVTLSLPAASLSLSLFLPCCKSNSYLMKHFGLGCCCHPCRKY